MLRRLIGCQNIISKRNYTTSTLKGSPDVPKYVKVVEVGPSDGLQNERKMVPTDKKVELINKLSETGIPVIEPGAFVSPKWIPQMADSYDVYKRIIKKDGVNYPVLIPNKSGLEKAIEVGAKQVSIFVSASETFSKQNINSTIEGSLKRYKEVMDLAKDHGIQVRGYVSCVGGCPYEGRVPLSKVVEISRKVLELGCYEISLSDTIGILSPGATFDMISAVKTEIAPSKLSVHFHDTYGQALANILVAVQLGVSTVDSSIGGLGGCPYARGATGNVSTEDVVYMLHGAGIQTGIQLEKLIEVGNWITIDVLGKKNSSKVALATERKGKLPTYNSCV